MIRDALRLHEATGDNADYKRGYKAGEFLSKSVSIEYIAAEKDIAQRKQLIKGLAKDETIMAFARMRHLHNESERFLQGYKDGFRAAFLKRLQRTSLHKMDPLEEALAPNDDERDILDFLERELKDAAQGHDTRVGHGLNRAGFRSNTTGPTQGRQRVSSPIRVHPVDRPPSEQRVAATVAIVYRLPDGGIEVDISLSKTGSHLRFTRNPDTPPQLSGSDFREESLTESPLSHKIESQIIIAMNKFAEKRSYRMFPAMDAVEDLANLHGFSPAGDSEVPIEHPFIHDVHVDIVSLIGIHLTQARLVFGRGRFDGADCYVLAFEVATEPGSPMRMPSASGAPAARTAWILKI